MNKIFHYFIHYIKQKLFLGKLQIQDCLLITYEDIFPSTGHSLKVSYYIAEKLLSEILEIKITCTPKKA